MVALTIVIPRDPRESIENLRNWLYVSSPKFHLSRAGKASVCQPLDQRTSPSLPTNEHWKLPRDQQENPTLDQDTQCEGKMG